MLAHNLWLFLLRPVPGTIHQPYSCELASLRFFRSRSHEQSSAGPFGPNGFDRFLGLRTVLMSRRHPGGSHMRISACVIAVLLAATSVLAHHSNSAFDGDKVMVLTGTVTEWKWTNPHVWIFLSVDDGKGGKVQWEIEGRTPGQLVRAGWSRTTLKIGETITVDFSPAKDGSRTGLLTRVRRADGTVVGQQGTPAAQ